MRRIKTPPNPNAVAYSFISTTSKNTKSDGFNELPSSMAFTPSTPSNSIGKAMLFRNGIRYGNNY